MRYRTFIRRSATRSLPPLHPWLESHGYRHEVAPRLTIGQRKWRDLREPDVVCVRNTRAGPARASIHAGKARGIVRANGTQPL